MVAFEVDVVKPEYYKGEKQDVIDFCSDHNLNFNRGNVCKYICRAGIKNKLTEIEDLEKAKEYLEREISYLKNR